MFLVAITNNEIAQNFQNFQVDEYNIHPLKITIITDKFLSHFIPNSDGFSIIESPLLQSSNLKNIIFSKVTYRSNEKSLSILKTTISGRSIYYYKNSKGEFYCSTHISLLRTADVPIQENTDVLPEFFVFRYVMPPETLFKDIQTLFPGSQLVTKWTNGKCIISQIERYIPPNPTESGDIDEITDRTFVLLNKSIQGLHPCQNDISILLSGGLDSSILFKMCQRNYTINETYSTGFPFEDPEHNPEKEYSVSAADVFKTNHHYFEPTSGEYLSDFVEAISKAEIPIHHLQSVLVAFISKKDTRNKKDYNIRVRRR